MDEFEPDTEQPIVLLLGGIAHDGVVSALSAAGRQYKQKFPESTVANWESINKLFERFQVREVLWKLTPGAYKRLAQIEYEEVRDTLIRSVSEIRHVVFVYRDLLSGVADPEWHEKGGPPSAKQLRAVNTLLEERGIQLMPYTRNAELTVLATEFIANTEQGLLFRVYIPAGRMWAEETGRLIQLFRDYLARVGKLSVRLDQTRTDNGMIYEFHGDEGLTPRDLSTDFGEFSHFLDLCVSRPEQASRLLADRALPARDVAEILTRYAKEARRLNVDLKHDRERRLLSIRQRLESELIDATYSPASIEAMQALVDAAVPPIPELAAVQPAPPVLPTPQHAVAPSITVNMQPQIISDVRGIVAQEIRGHAHLTSEDEQLLRLVADHGGAQSADLASAVHEVSDESVPTPARLVARQKLTKFLMSVGSRLTDVGAGVLQSYIEQKLGI